ncbi:MAG: Calx-beta domain-containing protein [Nocardioidaceae bacterium]
MLTPRRSQLGVLAVGSLLISGLGAGAAFALPAPSSTNTVADASAWYTQAYENFDGGDYLNPVQDDVTGPARTPFGTGSHQITIGQSTAQTELYRTNAYDGTKLSDLTRLEYSTFAKPTSGTVDRQPTYLRLSVDNDGTDTTSAIDASLFFYPANNGDQQAVKDGVWQNWDVTGGKINVDGDSGAGEMSIADYVAAHPNAVLVNAPYDSTHSAGALALVTGGALGGSTDPQTNGTYDVDRVIVGTTAGETLYDFGPNNETSGMTKASIIDPENLQGWVHQASDDMTGNALTTDQTFVHGPDAAPAGAGSLRFSLSDDTNPNRVEQFRTAAYDGTLLRDFRTLDFSTFQQANPGNTNGQQPVYLRLNLDNDGNGTLDDSLYYYPGNNGPLEQGAWQTWNAASGEWGINGDNGPGTGVTLDQYLVSHPDARIVNKRTDGAAVGGGVGFLVGGGGDAQSNGQYFLDNVTIKTVDAATGSTISGDAFDLEPTAPVVSVGDTKVLEGNKGATLQFPVTLDDVAGYPVTVNFATANGTAVAGKDYVAQVGTVNVPAGEKSALVSVKVLSDMVREGDDTVKLSISNPSYGTVGGATATGTIVNDDTTVGIALTQATLHRVRVYTDTLPVAPGATVKVYRVTATGRSLVLSSTLNSLGRISKVLDKQYAPGTKAKFFSTVRTAAGLYTSPTRSITIR